MFLFDGAVPETFVRDGATTWLQSLFNQVEGILREPFHTQARAVTIRQAI